MQAFSSWSVGLSYGAQMGSRALCQYLQHSGLVAGLNLHLHHCKVDSLPWDHQGSPIFSLFLNMFDVPALELLQWLLHLPEHSALDGPMTNSFASCKSFHKDHILSGTDLCPPNKFYTPLSCSILPYFQCTYHLQHPINFIVFAHFIVFITLLYYT